MHLPDLTPRAAGLDLALVVVVGVVGPFLPSLFAAFGYLREMGAPEGDIGPFLTVTKWAEAIVAMMLLGYLADRHRQAAEGFGVRPGHLFGWQILTVPFIIAACYVTMLVIGLPAMLAAGEETARQELTQRFEFAAPMPTDPVPAFLLLIPVALHEEILFRALMLPYLRRLTGSWPVAILLAAVLFGSLHYPQGLTATFQIAGVGIVLGTAFVLTRSLLAVVVAHCLFDFMQLRLFRYLQENTDLLKQLSE